MQLGYLDAMLDRKVRGEGDVAARWRTPGFRSRNLFFIVATCIAAASGACSAGEGESKRALAADSDSDGSIDLGDHGNAPIDDETPGRPVGDFCDEFEVEFEPKTPTVYILVDRSGSMADEGFWEPLRSNLLPVIEDLDPDVRFGFGSFSGRSGTCTGLEEGVPIADRNYEAIAAVYNGLSPLMGGETPTAQAIGQAAELLRNDESPGSRFILLVTDGNPDFCNNGEDVCSQDALIGALQNAFTLGVRSLVFGLEATQFPIEEGTLDRYANAGVGEAVSWDKAIPDQNGNSDIVYQCQNSLNWTGAGGTAPDNIGRYSAEAGGATAFSSDDPAALATEMRSSLAGLKSCQISLNFRVTNASTGQIYVDDTSTPIANEDWGLVEGEDDVIELRGASCDLWQSEGVDYFFAGFPCRSIVR